MSEEREGEGELCTNKTSKEPRWKEKKPQGKEKKCGRGRCGFAIPASTSVEKKRKGAKIDWRVGPKKKQEAASQRKKAGKNRIHGKRREPGREQRNRPGQREGVGGGKEEKL